MFDIQLDTFDIQARDSVKHVIISAERGIDSVIKKKYPSSIEKQKEAKDKFTKAINILKKWNFRYDISEIGASIFMSFEFEISSYIQEAKLDNIDARRALAGNFLFENFLWNELK
jgi:hypothetical protein